MGLAGSPLKKEFQKIIWRELKYAFLAYLNKDEERSAADRHLGECLHLAQELGSDGGHNCCILVLVFLEQQMRNQLDNEQCMTQFCCATENCFIAGWILMLSEPFVVSDVTAGTLERSDTSKWVRLRNKAPTCTVHFPWWSDSWCTCVTYNLTFHKKTAAGQSGRVHLVRHSLVNGWTHFKDNTKKKSGCRIHLCVSNHSWFTKHS